MEELGLGDDSMNKELAAQKKVYTNISKPQRKSPNPRHFCLQEFWMRSIVTTLVGDKWTHASPFCALL